MRVPMNVFLVFLADIKQTESPENENKKTFMFSCKHSHAFFKLN